MSMLTNRPARTRDELKTRVEAQLGMIRPAYAAPVASPFVAEPGDGKARCRAEVRTELDKSREPRPHGLYDLGRSERMLFEHALACMTYSQLWRAFYLLDEQEQSVHFAQQSTKRAQARVRDAMDKLKAFTDGVVGLQDETQRVAFDAHETLLVNLAAYELLKFEHAERHLANVQGEGPRTRVARRRLAANRLRAALPSPLFTWDRIAELVYASDRMFPQPAPSFLERCRAKHVDLAGLFKKDAQRDN